MHLRVIPEGDEGGVDRGGLVVNGTDVDGSLIEGPGSSCINHVGEVYSANGDGLVAEGHLSPRGCVADETVAGGVVDNMGQVVVNEGRF